MALGSNPLPRKCQISARILPHSVPNMSSLAIGTKWQVLMYEILSTNYSLSLAGTTVGGTTQFKNGDTLTAHPNGTQVFRTMRGHTEGIVSMDSAGAGTFSLYDELSGEWLFYARLSRASEKSWLMMQESAVVGTLLFDALTGDLSFQMFA